MYSLTTSDLPGPENGMEAEESLHLKIINLAALGRLAVGESL